MNMTEGPSVWTPRRSRAFWLVGFILAVFPFLLSTGIDPDVTLRQGVTSVYRSWRFSAPMNQVKTGSEIIFERQKQKSTFEDTFYHLLSRDFKIRTSGDFPKVRAYFHSSTQLQARIETEILPHTDPQVWEGSRRFVNNGILVGMWVALLLWLLGRSYRSSGVVALFLSLFWYVEWNILEIPGRLFKFFEDLTREVAFRILNNDWTSAELGRLVELSGLIWLVLLIFSLKFLYRGSKSRMYKTIFLSSFLIEPFLVYACSRFGSWGEDSSWWKVYLGSLSFRFVTVAHIVFGLLRPGTFRFQEESKKSHKAEMDEIQSHLKSSRSWPGSLLLLPIAFLVVGGWEWLHAILTPSSGDTILQLKVFFVGFILAFLVPSRFFSLWLGALVVSLVLPPTRGHWLAAGYMGVLLDGLLLGWWVTPFKGQSFVLSQTSSHRAFVQKRFFFITVLAWLTGTVFSSVGAPLPVCWVAMLLGVWAYSQLTGTLAQDTDSGTTEWDLKGKTA
jgi:hypothetical protein